MSLKTPSQDAQGRWDELLSPTQVLTEQLQVNPNMPQEQQQSREKTKKKCHGNRKEQNKRRRMRRRQQNQLQMNQDFSIINDTNTTDLQHEEIIQTSLQNNHLVTRVENKRKRQVLSKDHLHMSQSFSHLSVSQEFHRTKKKKSAIITTTNHHSNNIPVNVENNHTEQENNNINSIRQFKSSYLQVSDRIFKQLLSNAIADGDKIIECLNTNEKLQFIRQMTETTNNLQYFSLQRDLWQDYYNLGLKEGIWQLRVSKSFAKQHRTCRSYGFPKHIIEKRQQTIQHQLYRTINELQQYLIKLEEYSKQWQPSFDANIVSQAINECVKKGQQRLKQEFDYRRKMIILDADDRQLITKFYGLLPNDRQIDLAIKIWQTTSDEFQMKEYEEILRKRIYLQRLPSGIDKIINHSIDPIQLLLSDPILNNDRRASLISTCSKTLIQYKFDLMTINLDTIQNIKHGHQQLLNDLQMKLSQSNCTEIIKEAIEKRQQAMIERHELYLKHKLKTFFDEAPTANQQ